MIPGLAVLIAALGGFAFWRRRQAARRSLSGETSFMESKIQPDSFFGVSGGQRVDTRDGASTTSSASSSLNYSLSQLDAIGDVDPVAEADVYLAYGRDLQAEEILKEAQRSDPERLAIRTKLLEVYAKRADLKTFETQARQLRDLTVGEGEDWQRAQELGRQIDPTNPLYRVGDYGTEDTEPTPLEPLPADADALLKRAGAAPASAALAAATMATAPITHSEFETTDLPLPLDLDMGDDNASLEPTTAATPMAAALDELSFQVSDFKLEDSKLDFTACPPPPPTEPMPADEALAPGSRRTCKARPRCCRRRSTSTSASSRSTSIRPPTTKPSARARSRRGRVLGARARSRRRRGQRAHGTQDRTRRRVPPHRRPRGRARTARGGRREGGWPAEVARADDAGRIGVTSRR